MAQQPDLALGAAPPSTYRELYASNTHQAEKPAPARLLPSYRFHETAAGGERPTPASLVEQTIALSERRSIAFLCLLRTTGTRVEVRILHRMMRYLELPEGGGRPVDRSMGLLGDVRAAQVPVVEVDNTHYSLIGNAGVRVPTVATMQNHLDTAPPAGVYLGSFGADAPGTEVVRPRVTQVIPAKYAAAFVHRDGVLPDRAYVEIHGMLEVARWHAGYLRGSPDLVASCMYLARRRGRPGNPARGGLLLPIAAASPSGQRVRGGKSVARSPWPQLRWPPHSR